MSDTDTAADSAAPAPAPVLIPQPHGGALLSGGNGAGGRPSSEIRRLLRGDLMTVREEISRVMGSRLPCPECKRRTTDADLVRLADFCARYGLGKPPSYDDEMIAALGAVVEELAPDVWPEIRERWVVVVGSRLRGP